MKRFQITGFTILGEKIIKEFEAPSAQKALGNCLRLYGKLRSGYQIVELKDISTIKIPDLEKPKRKKVTGTEIDEEILAIYQRYKAGVINQKDYNQLRSLLGPIVRKAVRLYWTNLSEIATHDEIENELMEAVLLNFLPRYDPSRGKLLPFLRRDITSHLKKKWSRAVYVNSENQGRKRSRKEAYNLTKPHYHSIKRD